MPGVERVSIDLLVARAKRSNGPGVGAIALFPVIEFKTPLAGRGLQRRRD